MENRIQLYSVKCGFNVEFNRIDLKVLHNRGGDDNHYFLNIMLSS